ncbi:MAG: RNA-binding S4 domain-containing protein [Acutalibacteraceae bacterium]
MNIDIKIDTEYIKLQDVLKIGGVADTGGMAKVLIQEGQVKVNGETCLMRGKKMYSGDIATFEDINLKVKSVES